MVLAKTVTGQPLPLAELTWRAECRNSTWHRLCNDYVTLITF
jgi:hypothetical protein